MGKPESARRIETQILHFDGVNWHGYAYRWDEGQTDATLVETAGADRTVRIADAQAPGGHRRQTWHFHSRAECLRCHNPWGGPPLAFNVLELNKDHRYAAAHGSGGDAQHEQPGEPQAFAQVHARDLLDGARNPGPQSM